jgi:hypothetical protein
MDLRLPLGIFFSVVGAILVITGVVADKAIYAKSLGINVNLEWGLVLLVFGGFMLIFALIAKPEPEVEEEAEISAH